MAALRNTDLLKPHPRLGPGGVIPALSREEYAGLRDSIRANGMMQPIVVDSPSMIILDGHHRWSAAREMGLVMVPVVLQETGTEESNLRLGLSLNMDRRHLSSEQRREAASALLKANPAQSDRSVAAVVGLTHPTVADVRHDMENRGDVEKSSTRKDRTGRRQPSHKSGTIRPRKPKAEKATERESADDMAEAIAQRADAARLEAERRAKEAAERRAAERGSAPEPAPVPNAELVVVDAETEPVEGAVVLFVRALDPTVLPEPTEVGGMTDEDVTTVRMVSAWCARVIGAYAIAHKGGA